MNIWRVESDRSHKNWRNVFFLPFLGANNLLHFHVFFWFWGYYHKADFTLTFDRETYQILIFVLFIFIICYQPASSLCVFNWKCASRKQSVQQVHREGSETSDQIYNLQKSSYPPPLHTALKTLWWIHLMNTLWWIQHDECNAINTM